MKLVNIQEAKTHLSRLVEEAAAGEEIIIAKAGKPIVRLAALAAIKQNRKLGRLAGAIWESSDCWETDPELERRFYGDEDDDRDRAVAEGEPTE